MSIEYGLVFTFSRHHSILFQVTLSTIDGMSLPCFVPKKHAQKIFLIAKLLRINNVIYYVRRLCVSYRMNVRTSLEMLGVHR